MPTIYDGQQKEYFTIPTTSYGIPKFGFGFRKKKGLFYNLYNGQAFRDFGNNIVLGSAVKSEDKKKEFTAQLKQQEAIDKIISKTSQNSHDTTAKKTVNRSKADITGNGFKMC